jgi:hypothetical protein
MPCTRVMVLGAALVGMAAIGLYQHSPWLGMRLFAADSSVATVVPHLQTIADGSRSSGSARHQQARDYLLAQLRSAGAQAEVQRAVALSADARVVARVENVVARIPGAAPSQAVLFVAHYDSVSAGPGCGDDAAAVAVMLDAAHEASASTRLKNDVIFLFTDGEELGVLGSQAFVDQHPWMGDVGVVFNFDAGGVSGPNALWETQRGNGWLVREYARAVPFAVASSWTADKSYGTDFAGFRKFGVAGLSFGFVGGQFVHYHRATDSLANLDEDTLRHTRQTVVRLVRHFGNLPLPKDATPDAVFVSILGTVISYAPTTAWLLLILTSAAFAAVVTLARRRGTVSLKSTAKALGLVLAAMVVAALVTVACWQIVRALHPLYYANYPNESYSAGYYHWAFALGSVALGLVGFSLIRCRLGESALLLASAALWVGLSWLTTSVQMGASYIAVWPALACCAAISVRALVPHEGVRSALLLVLAAPAVLVVLPFAHTLLTAAGLEAGFVVSALNVLLLSALIPQLLDVLGSRTRGAAVALVVAGVALIGAGSAASRFTERQPECNSVEYVFDQPSGTALWRTTLPPRRRSAWLAQLLGDDAALESPSLGDRPRYFAPAPPLFRPVIAVRLLADGVDAGTGLRTRTLAVQGLPAGNATLTIESPALEGATIWGRNVPAKRGRLEVTAFGPAGDPVEVTVRTTHSAAIAVRVETRAPLQAFPEVLLPARPPTMRSSGDQATIMSVARFE